MKRTREIFHYESKTWMKPEEYYAAKNSEYYHNVISDEIDPLWHPADGKYYTSKSKFRKNTKAHGLEETGDNRSSEELRHLKKKAPWEMPGWKGTTGREVAEQIEWMKTRPRHEWGKYAEIVKELDG